MIRKRIRVAAIAATLASIAALVMGVSVIAPALGTESTATGTGPADPAPDLAARFGAFAEPLAPADARGQSKLQPAFKDAPGSIAAAQFDRARPADIEGSAADAWIVPAGDKVCLIVPDPVDGYGMTCSTAADISAGRAIAVLGGGPEGSPPEMIVAALVPDGGSPPDVLSGGNATPMRVSSNVAAAVLSPSLKVRTAAGIVDLSLFGPKSAG